MAKLSVVPQKIFGATGGTGEFGAFGSDSVGTPVTTKNLETIQSLAPYLQGWFAATDNANEPPRIQDMNGLFFLITSQLGYLFQNGVPEWHEDNEYYATVSYCQKGGVIYRSRTGTDGSPNLNNDPATDDGTNWESGEASYRQLKFDLDRLGFTGYALYTDEYLMSKRLKAESMPVGAWIFQEGKLTPTGFAAARSTANPSAPEYCPVIPRFDADHDISTSQVPQATIDYFNSQLVELFGYTSFSATLAGGVLTFASNAQNNALINLVTASAMVSRWHGSNEDPTFAVSGGLYTGARQMSLTIAGTNYPITASAIGTNSITLGTYPADGPVTVELGPTRIAGSTTSARLRKISGFVPVATGDYTGEVGLMMDAMDRMQGHWHGVVAPSAVYNTLATGSQFGGNFQADRAASNQFTAATMTTDGVNGTPRTGKTTNPRTHGVGAYTFLGTVLATDWT